MNKINLQEILFSKRPKIGNTLFIAVDGCGGSGKSTLAKWLAQKLGASLVQTDDFATWDDPNWWPLVIGLVFEPIKISLSIFVDAPREISLRRGIERDSLEEQWLRSLYVQAC